MSKKDNDQNKTQQTGEPEEPEILLEEVTKETEAPAEEAAPSEAESLKASLAEEKDKYLRLLAEYDNYRKRSQKEKEAAWTNAKAETVKELLPVYDNLERAVNQETADEAYAKGVQMTMNQLKTVLEKLGVTEIPAKGEPFDPNVHNAVMHVEDESLGENVITDVFQKGYRVKGKRNKNAEISARSLAVIEQLKPTVEEGVTK